MEAPDDSHRRSLFEAAVTSVQGPTLTDAQTDDSDVFVIGVREHTGPDAWSLLLMAADDEPDEPYCLVVDPGQATVYGGVLECEVSDESLRLRLNDDAAGELGMPPDTTFPLRVSAVQLEMLRQGFRRVLTAGRPDRHPRLVGL